MLFSFLTFSAGWTASNLVEPWLVDGGGRAVQGLPPQGASRTDGKVQQGRKEGTASRSLSWLTILKQFIWTAFSCSLPGQVGELSERLPEGGSVGDRHLRPQEDHEGNPDRLWQSRQTKEKVKVCKKTRQRQRSSASDYLSCVWTKTTVAGSNRVQQSRRKTFSQAPILSLDERNSNYIAI